MVLDGQLLPDHSIRRVPPEPRPGDAPEVVYTQDHDVIRRWAERRGARPATGEATPSGPATVTVNDGGAGIRFNFPGLSPYRAISWEEWFDNFDRNACAFVYENDSSTPPSSRYRIVKAEGLEAIEE